MKWDGVKLECSDASNAATIFHVGSWLDSLFSRVIASGVDFMKADWTTDHRQWYRNVYLNSEHWKDLKASKLLANPACERCGFKSNLDVHHVNYRNLFDVEIKDLLTLCRRCHAKEHRENGMPRRKKPSYWNYFPKGVLETIEAQRKAKLTVPYFDFKTKAGRIAYSIWKNPEKWRKSDFKNYGIRKPESLSEHRALLCSGSGSETLLNKGKE